MDTDIIEKNIIFIGSKPIINYIRSVSIQLNENNLKEVIIKSRGKYISKAVDVAEISKRNLSNLKVHIKNIEISSEEFENNGKKTNISCMEITLAKESKSN